MFYELTARRSYSVIIFMALSRLCIAHHPFNALVKKFRINNPADFSNASFSSAQRYEINFYMLLSLHNLSPLYENINRAKLKCPAVRSEKECHPRVI